MRTDRGHHTSGLLALVFALAATGVWVACQRTILTITHCPDSGPDQSVIVSSSGWTWRNQTGGGQRINGAEFLNLEWTIETSRDEPDFVTGHLSTTGSGRRWSWCGFERREVWIGADNPRLSLNFGVFQEWTIPHWSVAIPPMLLSLWLLLVQPSLRSASKSAARDITSSKTAISSY